MNIKKTVLLWAVILFAFCSYSSASGNHHQMGWGQATPSAEWAARRDHSALVFNQRLWIIAGTEEVGAAGKNDVFYSEDGKVWFEADTEAYSFPARREHQSVVFDGKMWVIGGGMENDIWFSTSGFKWTEATSSASWQGRNSHQALVFKDNIWVMGGDDGANRLNDVWSSTDGINWVEISSAAPWSARFGHQALVLNDKIWVLGGFDSQAEYMNDIWNSPDGENWEEINSSAPWSPREGHRALVYNDMIWVTGGFSEGERLSDVWYSPDGIEWEKAADKIFGPRAYHQALPFRGSLYLTGGEETEDDVTNDVWVSFFPPELNAQPLPDNSIEWSWNTPSFWEETGPDSPEDSGYNLSLEGEDITVPPFSWDRTDWITEGLEPLKEYRASLQLFFSTGGRNHYLKPALASAETFSPPPCEPDYFLNPSLEPVTGATRVIIRWESMEGVQEYRIERDGKLLEEKYKNVTIDSAVSYLDEGLTPRTRYLYHIFPLNSEGKYDPSRPLEISLMTAGERDYKAQRRFITPAKREVNFGENVKKVTITDIRGRTVASLSGGDPFIKWVPDEEVSGSLESGLYIYQLTTREGKIKNGTIVIAK